MDYLSYKSYERDAETVVKSDLQGAIFQDADLVAAVGPKLYRTVRDLAPNTVIIQLVPGCEELEQAASPNRFSLAISGRLSEKTDPIKQHAAAVLAFADCVRERLLGADPVLTVVGAEPESFTTMERMASERAKGGCNLVNAGVVDSYERYAEVLGRQSAVVVPSIYEGFSLVGWEALSAGIPVILSKNTGLSEFVISQRLPSAAVEVVDIRGHLYPSDKGEPPAPNEFDVKSLCEAYGRVHADYAARKAGAVEARAALRARYHWTDSASSFVGNLASTLGDRYYTVAFGVARDGDSVADGALSSKVSATAQLVVALKHLARSILVPEPDRELLAKAELEHVSEGTLTRLLEAWTEVPWDFYVGYSSLGKSEECVRWLLGMTIPVKGRRVFSVGVHGIDAEQLESAISTTLKRTRPETPHPTLLVGDDEAVIAKAVAGLARRVVGVIAGQSAPPPWLLVMDPRLRAAVDADSKKLHWRKAPLS